MKILKLVKILKNVKIIEKLVKMIKQGKCKGFWKSGQNGLKMAQNDGFGERVEKGKKRPKKASKRQNLGSKRRFLTFFEKVQKKILILP